MAEAKRAAVVLPPPQDEAVLGIVVHVRVEDKEYVQRNFCRVPRKWLDGIATQSAVIRVNSNCGYTSLWEVDNEAVRMLAARFVNEETVTDYDERLLWPDAESRARSMFGENGIYKKNPRVFCGMPMREFMAEHDDSVSHFFAPIGCVPLKAIDGNEPKTDKTLFILQTFEDC
jgi:hypothetical protein